MQRKLTVFVHCGSPSNFRVENDAWILYCEDPEDGLTIWFSVMYFSEIFFGK